MSRIDCRGGHTQIAKILAHVRRENDKARIGAWSSSATPWRKRSTTYATARANSACAMWPLCQEGYDPVCEQAFREIAHLTHGAYCRFTPGAPPCG
jgi:hypothetical protein